MFTAFPRVFTAFSVPKKPPVLNSVPVPDEIGLGELGHEGANDWLGSRWREYMAEEGAELLQ